ncbi:MAG TPA: DNA gyrase inhibitor YacG [Acidobacteriaceae bacterium]
MPKPAKLTLRCPTCSKLVGAKDAEFPFCSDRCRLIDLGKWASGAYRISTPIHDPAEMEELREGTQRAARSSSDEEE